jgi:hypothetical protein
MDRYRVVIRTKRSRPWESCYIVDRGRRNQREAALQSARQVLEQEKALGSGAQVGICPESGGKVTVLRG